MNVRSGQTWDAERYARNARFVSELATDLVDVLAPRPGERILDLGCGEGALSAEIAARGATVVAVDAAPDMVAAARRRGVDARVMNGEALAFEAEFDAVFSNAAMHWMRRADATLAGIRRALKPGGRMVVEFGGAGNIAEVMAALTEAFARRGLDAGDYSPWVFPTEDGYRAKLEAHGFNVGAISLFARPTPLPGGLGDWLDTFCESFLKAVPEAQREGLKAELTQALAPGCRAADGRWTLVYVRLRVVATP